LSENRITHLDHVKIDFQQLKHLYLYGNRFSELSIIFSGNFNKKFGALEYLDLGESPLKHLTLEILSFIPNLKHLHYSGLNLLNLTLVNVSKSLETLHLVNNTFRNLDSLQTDPENQFLSMKVIKITFKNYL